MVPRGFNPEDSSLTIVAAFRRATLAAAVAALAAAPAFADDTLATDSGDLVIHPIHHAALTLTWNGVTVLADPSPAGMTGDPAAMFATLAAPQIILITHEHGDHFNIPALEAVSANATIVVPQSVFDKMPADLQARAKVMANGDSLTLAGIEIDAVPAYNFTIDRLKFHPIGRDNGYVLTIGGKRIYVAGDSEDTPEMRALKNIDVAFVPMEGTYTMDVAHAADAIREFKPKIVYPYHYTGSDLKPLPDLVGGVSEVRIRDWYPK